MDNKSNIFTQRGQIHMVALKRYLQESNKKIKRIKR